MKRRVVLIADAVNRCQGGAEIYVANLAEFLVQNGHPVRVLVRRPCSEPLPTGVTVEVTSDGGMSGILGEWRFARGIRRRLTEPDAIVLSSLPLTGITHYQPHSGLYRATFAASRESLAPGFRQRFHQLGDALNFKRRWLMTQQEKLLKDPNGPRIMTFSHRVRAQFQAAGCAPESRLTTQPLGVDLKRFQPGGASSSERPGAPLRLLFVAHNFRLKGLPCLLEALAQATERGLNAELLILGKGARGPIKRWLCHPALAGRVRFLGLTGDQDMAHGYRACDVLVHPTFTDHCSLVVLEALACGRPVITTRQNGAAELMTSGKEGIIVPHPRDLAALTDALLQMQNRATWAAMSRAAAALRPRLDFAGHAQQVLAWLLATREERLA